MFDLNKMYLLSFLFKHQKICSLRKIVPQIFLIPFEVRLLNFQIRFLQEKGDKWDFKRVGKLFHYSFKAFQQYQEQDKGHCNLGYPNMTNKQTYKTDYHPWGLHHCKIESKYTSHAKMWNAIRSSKICNY